MIKNRLLICLFMWAGAQAMASLTVTKHFSDGFSVFDTFIPGSENKTANWYYEVPSEAIGGHVSVVLTIEVTGMAERDEFFSPDDDRVLLWLNGVSLYPGYLTDENPIFHVGPVDGAGLCITASIDYIQDNIDFPDFADAACIVISGESTYSVIPEPATLTLLTLGGLTLRKRK